MAPRPSGAGTESPPEGSGTLEVVTRSGETVPLLFVRVRGVFYVVPAARRTPWAAEIVRRGVATVSIDRGLPFEVGATLTGDPRLAGEVLGKFRERHGETAWARYFAGRTKVLALDPSAVGRPLDVGATTRAEFDAVAAGYARAVANDPADAYLRERSVSRLRPLLAGRDPLLEIGSGTGSETLPLLVDGHRIVAVDISPRMLEELRARADARGVGDRLTTVEGRLSGLEQATASFEGGAFAGAYSTFGAFNLEPDLTGIGPALARVLAPDAPVFLAVLNRHALMPLVAGVASGDWRAVSARLRYPIPAEGTRYPLDVYGRRPDEVTRALGREFRLESVEAASVLTPPDDLPRLRRHVGPRGKDALRRWDARLGRNLLARDLAEWQFLTYRRIATSVPSATGGPAAERL